MNENAMVKQCYCEKMTPSRRKLKAKGETSTLQTGKYNIMQTIYQSSQMNDKNASRELKNVFFSRFQPYAKAYVHDAYTSGASEFFKVMNIKKTVLNSTVRWKYTYPAKRFF